MRVRPRRRLRALLLAGGILALLAASFQIVYRPWQRNWGATVEEVERPMPGDEIIPGATFVATRAVTINGRPEEIWPWIVQIGYRRAGFYSYDRLDNDGVPSARRILPEYQQLEVGDPVPLSAAGNARVQAMDPGRSLLLLVGRGPPLPETFTWAWGLYPEDETHTRLVTRLRWRVDSAVGRLVMDAVEIWMMRKCLLGIKQRVERASADASSRDAGADRDGVGGGRVRDRDHRPAG